MAYTPPTLTPAIGVTYSFSGFTAKIVDVSFGGLKVDTKDATHQASTKTTNTVWREFICGLGDPGTITLKSEFLGTIPSLGTEGTLSIVLPTTPAKTVSCEAYLVGFKPDMKFGEGMYADVEFKITGVVSST